MVSCVACDLECGDVERLETHWAESHPSLADLNRSIERIRRQTPSLPRCAQCDIVFPTLSAWYTVRYLHYASPFFRHQPKTSPTLKSTMRSTSLYYDFPKEEEESTPLIARPPRPDSAETCGFWAMMKPKQVMSKLKKRRHTLDRRYSSIS
ncbi:hypothetical protein BDZ89DRAFT_1136963 [Hymenopellis radicata]|nr:hypothetical protein BDZ89DRAFT_1136963 [Hymenopellis radicata]